MSDKKILIIGGNGYIGSRLYEYLLDLEYDVDNVDICWFGKIYDSTYIVDYKNLTKEYLSKYSHIILLAGHSSVSMCMDNLHSTLKNNVLNFVDILNKIDEKQILIYASTCAIYGYNANLVDESVAIQDAKNFYDYSKICREGVANLFKNKKIIGLRFGSVGGFSKNFRNENLLNSISVSSLKNNSITIANGYAYRSILGINDLCRVYDTIISNDSIKNNIYNLSTVNDTILNFGLKIKQLSNCELIINESAYKTDYSFNCSAELFKKDYQFEFKDTVESIYYDNINNYEKIITNNNRIKISYE
jgi:nucleoside-diphosphate-sugar epimerase